MNCKNCDTPLTGTFCLSCGQKADIHRITFRHVAHEFFHAFTHADKGFLLLIKELFRHPGHVAREYIEGKRKKYFNPLSFLVITSAVQAWVTHKAGYFEAISHGPQRGAPGGNNKWLEYFREATAISANNSKLLMLFMMVPLLTILTRLFFWRPKHNLAEIFVLQSFAAGQGNVMRVLVFVPLFLLFPSLIQYNSWAFELWWLVYLITAYKQFYKQHLAWTILKSVVVLFLFIVFYWVFIYGYVVVKHLLFQ